MKRAARMRVWHVTGVGFSARMCVFQFTRLVRLQVRTTCIVPGHVLKLMFGCMRGLSNRTCDGHASGD